MLNEKLNVIDETGKVIGAAPRNVVHKKGLLHREIHVWLYTSSGKIIFQHRSKSKDIWPDKLDCSVAGHVDFNMSWEDTALKELEEEAGITASADQLTYICENHTNHVDPVSKNTNNVLRRTYAMKYDKPLSELHIEKDMSQGFEAWSTEALTHISKEETGRFISGLLNKEHLELYKKILALK